VRAPAAWGRPPLELSAANAAAAGALAAWGVVAVLALRVWLRAGAGAVRPAAA
jgi:hypothetical protein